MLLAHDRREGLPLPFFVIMLGGICGGVAARPTPFNPYLGLKLKKDLQREFDKVKMMKDAYKENATELKGWLCVLNVCFT